MTSNYSKVLKLLKSENVSAAINSYETLPTRNSPRTLISTTPKKDEHDQEYEDGSNYPFETLDTLHKKLSPKKDK